MNEFTKNMFNWAVYGEGADNVHSMMDFFREDGRDTNDLASPDLVGENIVDIFCDMYRYLSGDLWNFCQIGVDMVDEYRLGKMIIRYYDENDL